MGEDTEIIDKLFLELSQFTNAKTGTEILYEERIAALEQELAAMTDRRDRAMLATEEAEARVKELEKSSAVEDCNICGGDGVMFHADLDKDVVCRCVTERAAALEAELDRWQDREATSCPEDQSFEETIGVLLAQLAEAKKDTARLDWLESRKTVGAGFLVLDGATCTEVRFEWDAIDGPSSLRAAIDDAREE